MQIAILTFHYADNYGALLQAYALKEYLVQMGHIVRFIDYVPESEKIFYSRRLVDGGNLKGIVKKAISNVERRKLYKVFADFREKYLPLEKAAEAAGHTDLLLVGSDQVWNEDIVKELGPYLFQDFPLNIKRASYAASIGKKQISPLARKMFSQELGAFYAISVREHNSENIIREMGFNCTTVVDPVYLLSREDWKRLAENNSIKGKDKAKYALVYILRDDPRIICAANNFAQTHGYNLYYIHPLGRKLKGIVGKQINNAGPKEFVELIENAEKVFTNSFHAISFCAIFEKPFVYLKNETLGNRVESLLKTLRVQKESEEEYCAYTDAPEFVQLIANSKEYLQKVIASKEDV